MYSVNLTLIEPLSIVPTRWTFIHINQSGPKLRWPPHEGDSLPVPRHQRTRGQVPGHRVSSSFYFSSLSCPLISSLSYFFSAHSLRTSRRYHHIAHLLSYCPLLENNLSQFPRERSIPCSFLHWFRFLLYKLQTSHHRKPSSRLMFCLGSLEPSVFVTTLRQPNWSCTDHPHSQPSFPYLSVFSLTRQSHPLFSEGQTPLLLPTITQSNTGNQTLSHRSDQSQISGTISPTCYPQIPILR